MTSAQISESRHCLRDRRSARGRGIRARRWIAASCWLCLLLLIPLRSASQQGEAASTIRGEVFGQPLTIEVIPLDDPVESRDALADALEETNRVDHLLEVGDLLPRPASEYPRSEPGGVAALNAAAGQGPVRVDGRVLEVLTRALEYCRWSHGAFGPLGGMLNGLWGLRQRVGGLPSPEVVADQAGLTDCDRLSLDAATVTASLSDGSRVDLWGFEYGYAIDRVTSLLVARGFTSGWIQIGQVTRAFGSGRSGRGWPMAVDPIAGGVVPTERLLLHDRALAMASSLENAIEIAGERYPPYIDHRSGLPASGKAAVLVVAQTALDAQALASALFVLSNREGEFRLGALDPRPAVKWFLGEGEGQPLIMLKGWSQVEPWVPE